MRQKLLSARMVWRLLIVLILAPCTVLIGSSPAAALDTVNVGGYFEITYEPVEFSKTEINGDEVFYATVQGVATCTQDLPLTVSEARITGSVTATHQASSDKVTLNSSYTVTISPFPNNKDETTQSDVVISLQFPDGSQSGDYTVEGKPIEAKIRVDILNAWINVISFLPSVQTMGSVTYTAPGGGGGIPPPTGGAPPSTDEEVITNLFGIEASSSISSSGEILETIEAISEDETLTLTIPEGTIALDKDANPLGTLEAEVNASPPPPPEDASIIGLAYDFGPDEATFDPPITLTRSYDPNDIPEGVAEEGLVLAWYDEAADRWVELDCIVDTENNTITASIEHFTTFAIIGIVTPPEPVEPASVPASATFAVNSLGISPAEVNIGDEVTISLLVANTGGKSGSYKVTLKINGSVVATKEVAVSAGLSKEVTFTISEDVADTYSVNIDGLSGSFVVRPSATSEPEPASNLTPPATDTPSPPKPMSRFIVYSVAAALAAMGAILFFLVRRSHTKSSS